jgi:Uma2 family endonuclease
MAIEPAPSDLAESSRITVERYMSLVDEGILAPEDRVELLEGVVVAMPPRNAPHDTTVNLVADALHAAVRGRAAVRVQCTLILGRRTAPEPDVAVVPGHNRDYANAHPKTALLVVEVADSTLAQDRLTKAAIYAAAGIPEYWIVNLRENLLEVRRHPDPSAARYRDARTIGPGARVSLVALPEVSIMVDDLLPGRAAPR